MHTFNLEIEKIIQNLQNFNPILISDWEKLSKQTQERFRGKYSLECVGTFSLKLAHDLPVLEDSIHEYDIHEYLMRVAWKSREYKRNDSEQINVRNYTHFLSYNTIDDEARYYVQCLKNCFMNKKGVNFWAYHPLYKARKYKLKLSAVEHIGCNIFGLLDHYDIIFYADYVYLGDYKHLKNCYRSN